MSDRLYELLPAVYRVRDAVEGQPLRALLAVIEEEFELLEADVEGLYDNWFVETCDEWVVPYLADLLSVSGLEASTGAAFSQRAFVANTLGYRRAKGTSTVLEQLARDVTGWPAKAVEYFQLLATTRSMNHAPTHDVGTLSVRDANAAELVGTPLERAPYTVEVRHIDNARGKYNIPYVGIHLWRLQPYYLDAASARAVSPQFGQDDRFTFSPLKLDMPLFNVPRAETSLTQKAAEANVPGRLRRRPLRAELEARRQALVDEEAPAELFFDDPPVFRVFLNGAEDPVPPERVLICDLGDLPPPGGWRRPPTTRRYVPTGGGTPIDLPITVAVDPVRGRLAFPQGDRKARVDVSYAYGFPGDLGGGPYPRHTSLENALDARAEDSVDWREEVTWQKGVHSDAGSNVAGVVTSIGAALSQWNSLPPGVTGAIAVMDSGTYADDLEIRLKPGSRLVLVAADWPPDVDPDAWPDDEGGRRRPQPGEPRSEGRLTPVGMRSHIRGRITVMAEAPATGPRPELVIDGFLIDEVVEIRPGNLGVLRLAHCTLVPGQSRVSVAAEAAIERANAMLEITLERTISGRLEMEAARRLRVIDSIVQDSEPPTIPDRRTIRARDADIVASTILGRAVVQTLYASNSIFRRAVMVKRRQTGCVRHSYLPVESAVPRRFRCQPGDVASAGRIAPVFTSDDYGHPAYAQLGRGCPPEITEGADDEGELGAFHFLQQPRRLSYLTSRLDEYLRFGLEAGVFFVT